jgi:ATP-dependent RNA helicase DHX8/PRP22
MDSLVKLETLSLISKLTAEIDKETGVSDKTLAEFVIDIHDDNDHKNRGLDGFRAAMHEAGADFSDDFINRIDYLIRHMHPKFRKSSPGLTAEGKVRQEPIMKSTGRDAGRDRAERQAFNGLAIPDSKPLALTVDSDFEGDKTTEQIPGKYSERRRRSRSRSPPWHRRDPRDDRYLDRYQQEHDRRGRQRDRLIEGDPEVGHIYDARIANITTYGAFATLVDFRYRLDGKFAPICKD